MKKIRSSQADTLCTDLSKTQLFPVMIIKGSSPEHKTYPEKNKLTKSD